MEQIVTIEEEYTLPSKGLMYAKPFDPTVKLRSMTVADEMRRLSQTKTPFKQMADLIESCLLTKLPIPVYDLNMCDYTFLLHKLRITTYGSNYTLRTYCPHCESVFTSDINLEDIPVKMYDKSMKDDFTVTLPKSGKVIQLRLQTPRDCDTIALKAEEHEKETGEDISPLLNVASHIKSIDGTPLNSILFMEEIKRWNAYDFTYLVQKIENIEKKVGLDSIIKIECPKCHNTIDTTFRYTEEFFRPHID